jgi:hypothetical protein
MKPYPFFSLNHFTIPEGIRFACPSKAVSDIAKSDATNTWPELIVEDTAEPPAKIWCEALSPKLKQLSKVMLTVDFTQRRPYLVPLILARSFVDSSCT